MPRRRVVTKRKILPDPKYRNETVSMLVNCIMQDGKKALAYRQVYGAFDEIALQFQNRFKSGQLTDPKQEAEAKNLPVTAEEIPLFVFLKALENVKPSVEVRPQRIGGGTSLVPRPVSPARSRALGMRALKKAAIARKTSVVFTRSDKKMMMKLLALEIMDAYDNKGGAVKICQDMHRMAKANQAHVHFRLTF